MSDALKRLIIEQIQQDGPLPLAAYMRLCLTHPEYGYYATKAAIGRGGDFVTAPELTDLYGKTLANWVLKQWEKCGFPTHWQLVECGPGSGVMMRDMLQVIQAAKIPQPQIVVLDINSAFSAELAENLADYTPIKIEKLDELDFSADTIVVGSEFLDVFPIEQVHQPTGSKRKVTGSDLSLRWTWHAVVPEATTPQPLQNVAPEEIVETSPDRDAWLATLGKQMQRGAALFIDYGPREQLPGDTLQALQAGQPVCPLESPGAADLTAHVPFAHVAELLNQYGNVQEVSDMSMFLLQHGFAHLATTALEQTEQADKRQAIEQVSARLLSPAAMGSLFKVLVWSKDG